MSYFRKFLIEIKDLEKKEIKKSILNIDEEIFELERLLNIKQPVMDDLLYYNSEEYSESCYRNFIKSLVFGSISGLVLGFVLSNGKFIGYTIQDGGILAYSMVSIFAFHTFFKKRDSKYRDLEISRLSKIRDENLSLLNEKKDIKALLCKELKERKKLNKNKQMRGKKDGA